MKKITKSILFSLILFLIILLLSYLFIVFVLPLHLNNLASSTIIYDTNNIEIWEIINSNKIRHRDIKNDEIPEFYKNALINIEDKSFYNNDWISLRWLSRSVLNNIKSGKIVEWGSTISSQFIRNNLWLNDDRWIFKKALEFVYAIRLNSLFSKDEILEKYVNQIYFWYMNYGLKSASIYFFWKDPSNLTKAEQIALLVIPKNIKKYDPYINKANFSKRFKLIADYLEKNRIISTNEKKSIENEKLFFTQDHSNKLPYFADFLRNNPEMRSHPEVISTIDYDLTSKIEEIGKNTIYDLSWKHVSDYWVIIVDRKTDELKVMIGGMNFNKKEWQVNSTLALRQPWSAIKPFTYVLAFEKFWIKPNDTILDLPVNYKTDLWYSYEPKNYSQKFSWEVSIAEALAQSINIPAVKLLEKVWVKNLLDFLRNLKITSLNKDEDYYGLALTLWDAEISLFELLQAYTIFPNDWKFCEFKYIKEENLKCKNVIEKKYTDWINEILSDRWFKLPWYPVNSALDFSNKKIFVKTWTSRNFRDNWSLWYTKNYIIWVWTWNKNWENMKWVSWATWAWELFWRIVNYLEPDEFQKNLQRLNKISKDYLEITNPLDWEQFQINKFKSIEDQKIKLQFSSNISYDKYFWFLDNNPVENDFLKLESWSHKLEVKLMKDWEIIGQSNVNFEVE